MTQKNNINSSFLVVLGSFLHSVKKDKIKQKEVSFTESLFTVHQDVSCAHISWQI
jgi:hypothetical protein